MREDVLGSADYEIASEFICQVYSQNKICDVDKARFLKLVEMTGKIDKVNDIP